MIHPLGRLLAFLAPVLALAAAAMQPAWGAPNLQAVGTAASTNAVSISLSWPTHLANDIGLMILQTSNEAITVPAGWAHVLNSPQGTGTAAAAGSVRLTVLWKRAASNAEPAVTVLDPGNHVIGQIITFRGVIESGNPWDVGGGGIETTSDTSVSIPGATTTVPDTLVVAIDGHAFDSTSTTVLGTWANASLASPATAEIAGSDNSTNLGRGGGFAAAAGGKAAAGLYNATTATQSSSSAKGLISLALRPGIKLGDGTDPANASLAPGGAATMADAFTFQTTSGTNVVSAVVVGLASGTSAGLSLVEITDDAGTTVYGSVANPGSDTPSITLSTNTLTATTTSTQYKIRVTPKSHANMPAPTGSTYSVTAAINSWTSTYPQTGSDTAGTTVTIDNLSPANVTSASCTASTGQNSLAWTNPGDADFNSVVVLRNTSAVADTPVEGTTYAAGNTIGTSTVACSTSSASCTDTGLTNGTAYHYKIYARDGNVNYSQTGVVPTGSPCTPVAVTSFNVVDTGADRNTGKIFTKIAGQDIAVDVVALDGSAPPNLVSGFTGTVTVELVDGSTGAGICANMTQIKLLANETFTVGNAGRHPLSAGQFEVNSRPNVKFRIKYPTSSPTVTSCSGDAFALRPNSLTVVSVTDDDAQTAGTTRNLTNLDAAASTVHKAGRNFTIRVTAINGAVTPATTTNYAGSPDSATLSACIGTACTATFGTLSPGTWSADAGLGAGSVRTDTATYSEVGAFKMQLKDTTFSAVDASDGTPATCGGQYVCSATFDAGRFVPDHFTLSASTITNRNGLSCSPASSFSYMSEGITLAMTLEAHRNPSGLTSNYAGTLAKLNPATAALFSFGAKSGSTNLTSRVSATTASAAGWSAGSVAVTGVLQILRNAAPDGPHTGVQFGIAPADSDSVAIDTLDLDVDGAGGNDHKTIGATTEVRFGRLRLQNAIGSELADLPIPTVTQYWNSSTFVTNPDDSCTSLTAANVTLGAYKGGIDGTNLGAPGHVSPGGAFAGGVGGLKLTKPSPVPTSPGSATVTVDLAAEAKTYLQGNWGVSTFNVNPSARAGFGLFSSQPRNFIFYRENY